MKNCSPVWLLLLLLPFLSCVSSALPVPLSTTWLKCANYGATCTFSGNSKEFYYVRFGSVNDWSFRFVTGGSSFVCNNEFFGNPGGQNLLQCYVANEGFKLPGKWTHCGSDGGTCHVPDFKGHQTYYIKYGIESNNNDYSTVLEGNGAVPCGPLAFGGNPNPHVGGTRQCYYTPAAPSLNGSWVPCANPNYNCHLPAVNAVYQLLAPTKGVGSGANTMVANFATNGAFSCKTASFWNSPNGWGNVNGECQYNSYPELFYKPTGYWSMVESCSGARECDFSVSYGVTSTTTDSTSKTWSSTLTETTEVGIEFEKNSLSTSVSKSVTNTQEHAYSVSVTKTCSVSCPGNTNVWQWMMDTNELAFPSSSNIMSPFTTYSCDYICSNSSQVPKCPPPVDKYCVPNTNCQKCTQPIY